MADMSNELVNSYYSQEKAGRKQAYRQVAIMIRLVSLVPESCLVSLVQENIQLFIDYCSLFIFHNLGSSLHQTQRFEQALVEDIETVIFNKKDTLEEESIFVNNQLYKHFRIEKKGESGAICENLRVLRESCSRLEEVIDKNEEANLFLVQHEALQEYCRV